MSGGRAGSRPSAPPSRPRGEPMSATGVEQVATHADGHGRVRPRFEPAGLDVRVPPGVTLFDAASWNGVAIDSTCGGHGTCRKCGVQVLEGDAPITKLDVRAFGPDDLRAGWRLACR